MNRLENTEPDRSNFQWTVHSMLNAQVTTADLWQRHLLSYISGAERQSAQMTKMTNDGLTQSGIGCF